VSGPLPDSPDQSAAAGWLARLAAYKEPDLTRSVWQLVSAAALYAGAWALMYASLGVGYWLTLLLAVPAAFLLVRLFIIQHDCGHGAFFRSPRAADIVGSIIGVLTLTPYHYWKKTHAMHHATSGNLEHRGFGDIDTLTVDEYLARSRWERFKYPCIAIRRCCSACARCSTSLYGTACRPSYRGPGRASGAASCGPTSA